MSRLIWRIYLKILVADTNKDRRQVVCSSVKAIELAREKKFKEAFKELEKIFPKANIQFLKQLKYILALDPVKASAESHAYFLISS